VSGEQGSRHPVKFPAPNPQHKETALRASHPTLVAAGKALASQREAMAARWSEWLGERAVKAKTVPPPLVDRQFGLMIDVLTTMVGPLRRETKPIWNRVTEHYGRMAAARGLAAGEVVEEMQYLRELLIRYLAPAIAAIRPRQGMALFLRLNRIVDRGVTMAVAAYTDALVATLLRKEDENGDPEPQSGPPDLDEVERELDGLAARLEEITRRVSAGE